MLTSSKSTIASPRLLTFTALPVKTDTVHLEVHLTRTQAILGHIIWELPWRQYVFVPTPAGRYTRSVLRSVNAKLARLMYAWGKAHPSSKRGQPKNPMKTADVAHSDAQSV